MEHYEAIGPKSSSWSAFTIKRLLKAVLTIAIAVGFAITGMLPWSPLAALAAGAAGGTEAGTGKLPNILVIMGDDIGWTNISAYEKGIVGYNTPNIDRIANEGMLFTDYYGEQSCTAGRSTFITGQSALRTGLLKVGFPGAPFGIQDEDPTLAEMLKPLGYVSGQFGKNHLGDLNKFLPTVHGFDEFFGNLYHLNAEEEPENVDYPGGPDGEFAKHLGPRGVLDCVATDVYDPTEDERFGPWGKQECIDTGALTRKRMETIDEEFLSRTKDFIAEAVVADKPFFTWFNSTRMHYYTHIKDEVNGISGQDFYGDGMVEHDGHVGQLLDWLEDLGIADNTIVIYTTDNGPHYNQWPDGALTPFRGEKNTNWEGGYRVPALVRWPGHIPAGTVSHEIFSHLDWVPTLMAAAGVDDIKETLKQDCTEESTNLCGTYLDGYNQLPYLLDPEHEWGQRHGFIYFNDEGQLPGVRVGDWKVVFAEQRARGFDVWREPFVMLRLPKIFNLRRDPYERADTDSNNYNEWWSRRQYMLMPGIAVVELFLDTFEKYPPSQPPFSGNPNKTVEDIIDGIETQINQVAID